MNMSAKVALITGGTTGIGLAIAKELRDQGVIVIATGLDPTRIAQAAKELGGGSSVVKADVRDRDDLDRLFKDIRASHGRIDMLFANAGVGTAKPFDSVTEEDIDHQLNTNVKGTFFTIQKAVPVMKDGGSIVLTTSFLNVTGTPGFSILAATKAAVRSLVRTLGAELAARNIRVNAVSPGPISTPFFGKIGLTEQQLNAVAADIEAKVPLGRFGEADEVAKAAVYLASDGASYITGAELVVDGGLTQF